MPPLLGEAGKLLQRFAGADISPEASDDELACLAGTGPCSGTSGTTAGDAAAGQEATEGLAGLGSDERALALLLTLCPPLALAASNPDSFLGALEVRQLPWCTLHVLCVRARCNRAEGSAAALHPASALRSRRQGLRCKSARQRPACC